MSSTWQVLLGNLAVTALAISLWSHAHYRFHLLSKGRRSQAFGIAMGVGAICSMALAIPLDHGVFVDLRYSLVAIAALFGGPPSALLAMSIAACYRLIEGGSGAIDGVITIVLVALVSTAAHLFVRKRDVTLIDAAVLGISVSITLLLSMSFLPSQTHAQALQLVGVPMTVLNFASMIIAAFFLIQFEKMARDRDLLTAALTQTPDFHYVKDRAGRFVIVNRNVADHHHYASPADMVGISDFELATRSRAETLYAEEQTLMQEGTPLLDKIESLPVGDSERCYLTSKVPLHNRAGEVIGLAGATRDITDQKSAERELRANKDLLSLAMSGMSDGFAMFDRGGKLVFRNAQYTDLFPLSGPARVPGTHIRDILKAVVETGERRNFQTDVTEIWLADAAASLHSDKEEQIELYNGRWLSLRTRSTPDGMALITVSDITVMKEAEKALRSVADQMKGLAETDGLTGLLNRRTFDQALIVNMDRSRSSSEPIALMMIDVDRFKAYNDHYGHLAGDQCLKLVGDCLQHCFHRPRDVVARFGGEEFVVLLPNTSKVEAAVLAESFRAALYARAITHVGSEFGMVTASVGVSTSASVTALLGPQDLISEADAALYQAKKAGRDRVVLQSASVSVKMAG